jgi:hypothetical protein
MVTYPSISKWKPIELSILNDIECTTDAYELPRNKWPKWAETSTQFNRMIAYSHQIGSNVSTTFPSTGIIATLLTERIDLKDAPRIYNYNIYLIAETTDGRLFQSSPIIPNDPVHHSSSPSTWFDKLGSPL